MNYLKFLEINKLKIENLINISINHLNEKEYTFLYGYKAFIPNSGLMFYLDFTLKNNTKLIKRISLFRPLGQFNLIKNDIYNSSHFIKKINLLFSLKEDFSKTMVKFLCTEIIKVSELIDSVNFLLIKKSDKLNFNSNLSLNKIKTRYEQFTIKKRNLYFDDDYVQLVTIRYFSKILLKNSIIFYLPTNARFGRNLLKRVILNTIMERQVFFPVAFNYYPFSNNDILKNNVNQANGYFDHYSNQIVSFYNLDFIKNDDSTSSSIFDLFKKSNLKILKVSDNDLKCKWKEYNYCHYLSLNASFKCMKQRQISFGDELTFLNYILKN